MSTTAVCTKQGSSFFFWFQFSAPPSDRQLASSLLGTARRMLTLAPAPICQSPTGVKALNLGTRMRGRRPSGDPDRAPRGTGHWRAAGAAACLRAHAFPLVH